MAKQLTVNRQKRNIFTVRRQFTKPILAVIDWGQVTLFINELFTITQKYTYVQVFKLLVTGEGD